MRILIATAETPFEHGGAERHVRGLRDALRRHGHEAELLTMPHISPRAAHLIEETRYCGSFDASRVGPLGVDLLIGMKFPTYLVRHPRKVVWLVHQYRAAYELWEHPDTALHRGPEGPLAREAIRAADRECFAQAGAIFAGSANVAARLEKYTGVRADVLYHPPPDADDYYCDDEEDYVYFPSRLTALKRHPLVLEALKHTRYPVEVRLSWTGIEFNLPSLRSLAERLGVQDRVRWLGTLSPTDKCATFARCLGVIFPPYDEDYGYVTLEAMLAGKPVITCTDSGGPREFVRHRETGLVTEPSAEAIAEALDELWADRKAARNCGRTGRDLVKSLSLSWDTVVETLLADRELPEGSSLSGS